MGNLTITCCSDLHRGPAGHPATDATPGWAEAWSRIRGTKLRLGDMDELLQFTAEEIGALAGTDVDGNHDEGSCGRREMRIGDTLFLHGHRFDHWSLRLLGPAVSRLFRRVERWWPDADLKATAWLQKALRGGRHGWREHYIRKATGYATKRGARQIVFGHLHQRFEVVGEGIRVVCTGSCVNGRLDFVPVEVEVVLS